MSPKSSSFADELQFNLTKLEEMVRFRWQKTERSNRWKKSQENSRSDQFDPLSLTSFSQSCVNVQRVFSNKSESPPNSTVTAASLQGNCEERHHQTDFILSPQIPENVGTVQQVNCMPMVPQNQTRTKTMTETEATV